MQWSVITKVEFLGLHGNAIGMFLIDIFAEGDNF
jgi:hypothetical protein